MTEDTVCLISLRNLGDAALHSGWLAEAARRGYARRYLVWTKPESAALFAGIPDCDIVVSPAPIGTNRRFSHADVFALLRAAASLRRKQPSVTLDLVGDFRERLLARLVCRRHVHIGWAAGHPFGRIIRNPLGVGNPAWVVPAAAENVYAAVREFLDQLCPRRDRLAARWGPERIHSGGRPRVGLHPFASQACKLWPLEQWRELAVSLQTVGADVRAFCAPVERPLLVGAFTSLTDPIDIFAGSLEDFIAATRDLDLMIGLDSFAVHVAERAGVRSITLNGANPPALWTPPRGMTLADDGGCPYYPCYNVPKCVDGPEPYACIRSISVARVQEAAVAVLGLPETLDGG